MKVTLSYDPENGSDKIYARGILDSGLYKMVLSELDNWLRGVIKYDSGESENTPHLEAYQAMRSKLWELCKDENIDPHSE